jgi:uncharacterized integral membrane protein (TIGR00697 family)
MKSYRHLDLITALFVAVLIISNLASTKIVSFGSLGFGDWSFPLAFDAGTLLFPLAYIFGDVLTEVYGYARSRRVIWLGFISAILLTGMLTLVTWLPPATEWTNQIAFTSILGQMPRIVAASLIAYLIGEFTNSYILAKLKIWTDGKKLWLRTIGSTLVGEGLDTTIFCLIAFYGSTELLITIIISNYVFKVGIEVLATPFTYAAVAYLKKAEEVDHYDRTTNFNPLKLEA